MWGRCPLPSRETTAGVVIAIALVGCSAAADTPTSTAGVPTEESTVTVVEARPEYEAVAPGRYVIKPIGLRADDRPWAVIEVTSGAFKQNGVFLIAGADASFRALGLWTVAEVAADPCSDNTTFLDPGPTVTDLATALSTQPLTNGTDPVPVSLDGYDGLYLEISVPTDIDADKCVDQQFVSYRADDGGPRYHQGPGQVDRLWILDVEGNRLVLGVSHMPGNSPEEVAELTQMVESTTFTNTAAS